MNSPLVSPTRPGPGSAHVEVPALIERERAAFTADATAMAMLEAMPGPAMVLDGGRHVVLINRRLHEALGLSAADLAPGSLPGDVLGCRQAATAPGACGSTEACQVCGANRAIRKCLADRDPASEECRLRSRHAHAGGALDFRVHAAPVQIAGIPFLILALQDISSEKRRLVLERTFFHDLLNTCGGLQGLAQILAEPGNDPAGELELKQELWRLSGHAVEQIASQRTLLAAERGELAVQVHTVDLRSFLEEVAALYRHHDVARDRNVVVEPPQTGTIETDSVLLGRVVGNLVKNALEATGPGGTVTLRAGQGDSETLIEVHNPGLIPREVQLQLFQRSFSTKAGEGRGIGTYSVRLLTEQYLRGRVRFVSAEESGTSFQVAVPNRFPALPAAGEGR